MRVEYFYGWIDILRCAWIFQIFVLMIQLTFSAQAEDQQRELLMRQNLKGMSVFNGDSYGDFKGDLVAILTDESAWKVHPLDSDIFNRWSLGDNLYIRVRKSFYWFKREHKFELCNETRNEKVRAMFVEYAHIPLSIVACHIAVVDAYMAHYTTTDNYGNTHYHYYPVYTYQTNILLSDGSQWKISDQHDYKPGEKICIIFDREEDSFIFIQGVERKATYKKVVYVHG